ncbi:MAG: 5'-nucleotidase [Lachnospiraceae bacterium]|nr:5'-nucleotidase [Lachnospiraceae bacterium]MDD6192658.1 5'-nucleotidase [Lachnospiraceae bacterium]MDY4792688.1 5'-nucleotidase [Pararoseburia sp.]
MERCFTIGISTRALFDLEKEHQIFETEGAESYVRYQIAHEADILKPGAAFPLIQAFLKLNELDDSRQIEVVIMSKNSADAGLRIFHSIAYYGLDITRAALTTGAPIAPYLTAYGVDLYLSYSDRDVKDAIASGVAAGLLLPGPCRRTEPIHQIRIAFDGDAVLFSPEAERIFLEKGKEAFCDSEKEKALVPLAPGPFAHILRLIARIQKVAPVGSNPIRTALVTARSAPAHERVIRTLQYWGVRIDEAFFLGGMDKSQVLSAFGAHIFFDDSEMNTQSASKVVLSARVPVEIREVG